MLDNLRAMAVFAGVVDNGSFGGAAKEFGITTSAVSQQIRVLENDLGVVLLHRSTRKLSLTEAGASFYTSARQMVQAAEEARENVSQLRDGLLGSLRIATTPTLACAHILPALSVWLKKHEDLSLRLYTSNDAIDMIDERVDVAVFFALESKDTGVPLVKTKQVLLASPSYLAQHPIGDINDLSAKELIGYGVHESLVLTYANQKDTIKTTNRFITNDAGLALNLALSGHGVVRSNTLEAKTLIDEGKLVVVLPDYELPQLVLYGKTLSKDQQPAKVWRCLEVLTEYFSRY